MGCRRPRGQEKETQWESPKANGTEARERKRLVKLSHNFLENWQRKLVGDNVQRSDEL